MVAVAVALFLLSQTGCAVRRGSFVVGGAGGIATVSHGKGSNQSQQEVQEEVVAGSWPVKRGEGRFAASKRGQKCEDEMTKKLTDELLANPAGHWAVPYCISRDIKKTWEGYDISKWNKAERESRKEYDRTHCASEVAFRICYCKWYRRTQSNSVFVQTAEQSGKDLTPPSKWNMMHQYWDDEYIDFMKNKTGKKSAYGRASCQSLFKAPVQRKSVPKVSRGIARAAKICDAKSVLKPCNHPVSGYCQTYCRALENSVADCKKFCGKWCVEARDNMWAMNPLSYSKKELKKQYGGSAAFNNMLQSAMSRGRHPHLEGLMRAHILKCMCANRMTVDKAWCSQECPKQCGSDEECLKLKCGHQCKYWQDTRVCYEGGAGIPLGENWCQFADTPSWRQIKKKYLQATQNDAPSIPGFLCEGSEGNVMTEAKIAEFNSLKGAIAF